ncbi:DUF2288 domain-containing protein [Thiocystis violacea]|uniref:DUF2288 domain-containing protein n=1 Tax=Thiocystis violacea TaxID=13725 RepID=UPI0019066127|nr:DUF2288 domain-containing protein [Thiocystis violacea]MBK1717390.1 hypothetical protein [Thiocystis violacea]
MTPNEDPDGIERARLNQETARIPWRELQRFFAQGRVIEVAQGLDLIEVGLCLARDEAATVAAELSAGRIVPVGDAQARAWLAADAEVWALVVKPWILVQEALCASGSTPTLAQG